MDILINSLVSFIVMLVGGVILLKIEYEKFNQDEKTKQPQQIAQQSGQLAKESPSKLVKAIDNVDKPWIIRLLEMLFFSFIATFVAASIGYEDAGYLGTFLGIIFGLIVSLFSLWAIDQWWQEIAVFFAYLALVVVVLLMITGLLTLAFRIIGMPMSFTDGLLCLVFLVALAVMGVLAKLEGS